MRLDDIDRGFAFVFLALAYVGGMVFLWEGLAHAFGEVVVDFSAAAGLLIMSITIGLEIRR